MTYKCETCDGTGARTFMDSNCPPRVSSSRCPDCDGSGHQRCETCFVVDATVKTWVRSDDSANVADLLCFCAKCFALYFDGIVAIEPDQEPRTTETACCFRFTTCDVMGTRLNDEPAVTLARLGQFESWSPGQAMAIAAAIVAAARFAAKPK